MSGSADRAADLDRLDHANRALVRRWYPRDWRDRHEDALVGLLVEDALATGRSLSGPERVRLVGRGVGLHLLRAVSAETRDLAASLATGTGTAFALVYCAFRSGPDLGEWSLVAHAPQLTIALLWAAVIVATVRRSVLRIPLLVLSVCGAIVLPALRLDVTFDSSIGGWSRPSHATVAFLVLTALVALSGAPDRRLALRAAVPAAIASAALILLTRAGLDAYDLALWASPTAPGGPGSLGALLGVEHGIPPWAGRLDSPIRGLNQFIELTVGRLAAPTVVAVGIALAFSVAMLVRRRRTAGLAGLVVAAPAVLALSVAAHDGVVWFQ